MFLQTKTGKHFTEIPSNEALTPVYEILNELDLLRRVPAFKSERERFYLAVVFYNLIYRFARPSYSRDQIYDKPYVCLARGTQFYSGKYLEDRPHLDAFIGKGKLTHRLAKKIARYLVKYGICYESIGFPFTKTTIVETESGGITQTWTIEPLKGQMTRLLLIPDAYWQLPEEVKAKLRQPVIQLMSSFEEKDYAPAVHREKVVNEYGQTTTVTTEMNPVFVDAINEMNAFSALRTDSTIAPLLRYRAVFGKNLHAHGRLYAPLTSYTVEARNLVFNSLGFVEHDISACAYNICYLMETDSMFSSPEFGTDIYSDIIYTLMRSLFGESEAKSKYHKYYVRPFQDEVHYMRPMIKQILTISQGCSYRKSGQMIARINQILINCGFMADIRGAKRLHRKWCRQNKDASESAKDSMYGSLKQAANKARKENWIGYIKENGLNPKAKSPKIFVGEHLYHLFHNEVKYQPLVKYMFNGSYRITTNVETLANMMLHKMAMDKNIFIHTLHDAVYCKPEHMTEVKDMQEECMRTAANLKRQEIRTAELWTPILHYIEESNWKPKYTSMKSFIKDVDKRFIPFLDASAKKDGRGVFKHNFKKYMELKNQSAQSLVNTFTDLFKRINSSSGNEVIFVGKIIRSCIASDFFLLSSKLPQFSFLQHYRTTIGEILGDIDYLPLELELYVRHEDPPPDEKED